MLTKSLKYILYRIYRTIYFIVTGFITVFLSFYFSVGALPHATGSGVRTIVFFATFIILGGMLLSSAKCNL